MSDLQTNCSIGEIIRIDAIAARRTREGRLALSIPERIDSHGRQLALVRHDRARRAIVAQAIAYVGKGGWCS
jgi:hypothetical protein